MLLIVESTDIVVPYRAHIIRTLIPTFVVARYTVGVADCDTNVAIGRPMDTEVRLDPVPATMSDQVPATPANVLTFSVVRSMNFRVFAPLSGIQSLLPFESKYKLLILKVAFRPIPSTDVNTLYWPAIVCIV